MGLTVALVAAALSMVSASRAWFHSSGRLHVWYHVGVFAVLGLLAMLASRRGRERALWLSAVLLLGLGMEYGEAVHFHMVHVEWMDVRSDTLGVVLGALLGGWWQRRRGRTAR